MISFTLCLLALIIGYFTYGKFIEKLFGPDDRPTPVTFYEDGVDYVRLPNWKIFMIQFLNIAGTGPIFGAILGAKFGVSCFLWITFGCIFGGAVHDYLSAMLCLRHGGKSLPEVTGHYLGNFAHRAMLLGTALLLILVGSVFVYSPAIILHNINPLSFVFWAIVIFVYYLVAAIFPIDKIIGKVYPIFALALLFMAGSFLIYLFAKQPVLPELWDGLGNSHPEAEQLPLFPTLFISVACGALSGFHATQSPMMCRCLDSEHHARPIFFGAMITEGIVALIWAAIATYFFHVGADSYSGGSEALSLPAPTIVQVTSEQWLGVVGGILALLGVVAAPITTGDTALRSARLIIADAFKIDQSNLRKRLQLSLVLFAITGTIIIYSQQNPNGFDTIWRYFAWSNQTLGTVTLWTITVYLSQKGKYWAVTFLPAMFMTCVVTSYFFIGAECLGMAQVPGYCLSFALSLAIGAWFLIKRPRCSK